MNEVKVTGGARVGRANATKPFAKLKVSRDLLELNAGLLGNHIFLPSDIVSIQPTARSFKMSKGLAIIHNVPGYKSEIIFWTTENLDNLMRQIEGTGFLTNKNTIPAYQEKEVRSLQRSGAFPLKKGVSWFFIIIWNLLIISGIALSALSGNMMFGQILMGAAAIVILVSCLLTLTVPAFATLLLKEGRKSADIRPMLLFIMAILTFISINFFVVISNMGTMKAFPFGH